MEKVKRNDSWTAEEDVLLAKTLLETVKAGGTQLTAFKSVGEKVGRTSAAVGFRWNSEVRKRYASELAEAKKIAKENKKKVDNQVNAVISATEPKEAKNENSTSNSSSENRPASSDAKITAQPEPPFEIEKAIKFLEFINQNYAQPELAEENKELKGKVRALNEENEQLKKELQQLKKEFASFNEEYEAIMRLLKKGKKLSGVLEEVNA